MARLLLLALGSRGDVQPLAALASALSHAGHEVVLATPEGFTNLVEATPVHHVEVCPGLTPAEVLAAVDAVYDDPDLDLDLEMRRHPVRTRRLLLVGWASLMERALAAITEAGRGADAVVWWEPVANFGRHLAAARGVPGIACGMNPENWMSSTIAVPPPTLPLPPCWLPDAVRRPYVRLGHTMFRQWTSEYYRPQVDRWRRDTLGLPRLPHLGSAAARVAPPTLRLTAVSPLVRDLPPEWEGTVVPTGAWTMPAGSARPLPDDLLRFLDAGPPPMFASMGTAVRPPPHLGRRLVEAARRSGVRLVLGEGWDGRGGLDTSRLPEGCISVGSVPHDQVFPLTAGVVHHGGGGSTAAVLEAGVPSIALPVFGDQFYWGDRISALGVGPEPIRAKRASVDLLTAAMARMVHDRPMRCAASELGARLRAEDGPSCAVAHIEAVLRAAPRPGTHHR